MSELQYVTLREIPEKMDMVAQWFHEKWGVPKEAYLECIEAYVGGETEFGWYLCLDGEKIVGGMGVIENDFHDRKDLSPNVCAVYTEPAHRGRGIAGQLLEILEREAKTRGITKMILHASEAGRKALQESSVTIFHIL